MSNSKSKSGNGNQNDVRNINITLSRSECNIIESMRKDESTLKVLEFMNNNYQGKQPGNGCLDESMIRQVEIFTEEVGGVECSNVLLSLMMDLCHQKKDPKFLIADPEFLPTLFQLLFMLNQLGYKAQEAA